MTEELQAVIARLGAFIDDDSRAIEHERMVERARAERRRADVLHRLVRDDVALKPDIEAALVADTAPGKRTKGLVAAQRWLSSDSAPAVLVLTGRSGCGKSVAAAWALANGPQSCAWVTRSKIIQAFVGYFGESVEAQERYLGCRLLVIDDVGTELDAERMQSVLIEILDARKRHPRITRTLITTNLSEPQWRERYPDERLHSRLRECAVFITDPGPDLRGVPK